MRDDPYLHERLMLARGGVNLRLLTPRSAFSSARIDDGTILLLDSLPGGEPGAFLDLGCGYGALGLALALRHPESRGILADRDLLAIEFARRNAEANRIENVRIFPSLGFRDVGPVSPAFDWILCNFPARAGERVLEAFIQGGIGRLLPGGEMRIVVIAPLVPGLEAMAARRGFGHRRVAATQRHEVHAFLPAPGEDADDSIYVRDSIEVSLPGISSPLRLERPTDLADEPLRLPSAIPLLADALPSAPPGRVLCFRAGYGLIPAIALERWPAAQVTASDRDLLASAFLRRNLAPAGRRLEIEESLRIPAGPFDLILGELSPPLGPAAMLSELREVRAALAPGGRALVLGLAKQWREFLREASGELGITLQATRGGAGLFGMGG